MVKFLILVLGVVILDWWNTETMRGLGREKNLLSHGDQEAGAREGLRKSQGVVRFQGSLQGHTSNDPTSQFTTLSKDLFLCVYMSVCLCLWVCKRVQVPGEARREISRSGFTHCEPPDVGLLQAW